MVNVVDHAHEWAKEHASEIGTGIAIAVAVVGVAAFCGVTAGLGCLIVAGAIAGAAGSRLGYGAEVALDDNKSFSTGDLAKQVAFGAATGAAVGGAGKALGLMLGRAAPQAAKSAEAAADTARAAGRETGAAAELHVGRRVFTDISTGGVARTLHKAVQKALDAVPLKRREPWHGACAEKGCLSQALNSGVDPAGGWIRAVAIGRSNPGHGLPKKICRSCAAVLDEFGVKY